MSYNLDPSLLNRLGAIESRQPSFPIEAITPSTTGNVFAVTHGLGRVPQGFIVVYKSGACDVYDSGAPWDDNAMYLRATAPDVLIRIQVI